MIYKGHELKPLTERNVWDKPHKMLCWDEEYEKPEIREVVAFFPELNDRCHVVCIDGGWFAKCAEIPEEQKPRRATNRELSKWLAQGNGECLGTDGCIYTHHDEFLADECDDICFYGALVRKWDDTEWHEPT